MAQSKDHGRAPSGQALVASDQAASRLAPLGFDPSRIRKMLWAIYMRIDTMPKSNLNMGLDFWTMNTLAIVREAIELIGSNGGDPAAATFAGIPEARESMPPSASAIEAATAGETTKIGSTEGESAVAKPDAQQQDPTS